MCSTQVIATAEAYPGGAGPLAGAGRPRHAAGSGTKAPMRQPHETLRDRTHLSQAHTQLRNYPPAEPEASPLRTPQRVLIAIAQKQQPAPQQRLNVTAALYRLRLAAIARPKAIRCQNHPPGAAQLLLPPRQSRGSPLVFRQQSSRIPPPTHPGDMASRSLANQTLVNRKLPKPIHCGILSTQSGILLAYSEWFRARRPGETHG